MLYDAFQFQEDALAPVKVLAGAFHNFLAQPWPLFGDLPAVRSAAAAFDLVSHAGLSHQRPPFGIHTTVVDGQPVAVDEEVALRHPFCDLIHFRKETAAPQPVLLMVAPMSGHFATLLTGTVATMLPDHDIYLTDWRNARDVALAQGGFDLDDFVAVTTEFIRHLGPRVHVMAVCQPAVPVLAAAALMAAAGDPLRPASMILMGGPIDPRANPTEVNRFGLAHSLDWFERNVITTVPARYPGALRRVYPGFLQLAGFIGMNLDRHVAAHWSMFREMVRGDEARAGKTRAFYDEYTAVMDLPAEFYLQTIRRVFQDFELPEGRMRVRGVPVDPAAIRDTALMTIEGERDDICAVGQTFAAHALCSGLDPAKKTHHMQAKVGHYGVFHGRLWQTETYPRVRDFIKAQG